MVSKQTTKAIRIKSIFFTLVLSVIFFIGLVKIVIPLWKSKSFTSVEWKADKSTRYRMVNDLLESKQLNNLSQDQVVKLLGTEYTECFQSAYCYWAQDPTVLLWLDDFKLIVWFDEYGSVSHVEYFPV
jgi:hypothetical protein